MFLIFTVNKCLNVPNPTVVSGRLESYFVLGLPSAPATFEIVRHSLWNDNWLSISQKLSWEFKSSLVATC